MFASHVGVQEQIKVEKKPRNTLKRRRLVSVLRFKPGIAHECHDVLITAMFFAQLGRRSDRSDLRRYLAKKGFRKWFKSLSRTKSSWHLIQVPMKNEISVLLIFYTHFKTFTFSTLLKGNSSILKISSLAIASLVYIQLPQTIIIFLKNMFKHIYRAHLLYSVTGRNLFLHLLIWFQLAKRFAGLWRVSR